MATEEIEISDLELIEKLSPDNVLPIETTTKTFATTLKKIRDWLGIESAILKQVPTGLILPYGGSTTPEGFLLCNGATIKRTTYANLFKAIGTTYGAGDGSTTFKLPNFSSGKIMGNELNVVGNGNPIYFTDETYTGTSPLYVFNQGAYVGSSLPAGIDALYVSQNKYNSGLKVDLSSQQSVKYIIKY